MKCKLRPLLDGVVIDGETALTAAAIKRDHAVAENKRCLKNGLDPSIEARLAEVVYRLRADWIGSMADHWLAIYSIRDDALGDLDKRVSTSIYDGFFHFAQFLCALEILVLKRKELAIVGDEALLSAEKLVVQLSNDRSHLVRVTNGKGGLSKIPGERQGADGAGEK